MQKTLLANALALASSMGVSTISQAAGLEYDKQSVTPLFEPGTYAEVAYAHTSPEIEAKIGGVKVNNIMNNYTFQSATVKIAPTRDSALALMYEQPWGVDTKYPTGSLLSNSLGTTSAKVETDSLTLLGGGRLNNNVWIFGGISAQQAEGNVNVAMPLGIEAATELVTPIVTPTVQQAVLQGAGVTQQQYDKLTAANQAGVLPQSLNDQLNTLNAVIATETQKNILSEAQKIAPTGTLYNLKLEKGTAIVPVVGIGFEKPAIALKTSLTYRGKAKFNLDTSESVFAEVSPQNPVQSLPSGGVKAEFPQSVNFDFQTGLSEKYRLLGMLNARWVNWKDFEVKPQLLSTSLVNYEKDQYSVEAAVGKEFNPKLSAEVRFGYDSGTGQPLSSLGPYNSVKSLALGAQYKLTPALALSGGAQYSWLEGGDIVANGTNIGKVEDGTALSFGTKLGYHF